MRIKVPLSKKLNPGDAIYMIYYVVHTPNLQNASVSGCSSVVKSMLVRPINNCLFETQRPTPSPTTKQFARKGDPSLCTEGAERA